MLLGTSVCSLSRTPKGLMLSSVVAALLRRKCLDSTLRSVLYRKIRWKTELLRYCTCWVFIMEMLEHSDPATRPTHQAKSEMITCLAVILPRAVSLTILSICTSECISIFFLIHGCCWHHYGLAREPLITIRIGFRRNVKEHSARITMRIVLVCAHVESQV